MRIKFDEQLALLNHELIAMGALCEEAIAITARSVMDNDRGLSARVRDLEYQIDQKEREIETICLKLLLQQQPVATDLRVISSALKMITDLERIGDQASDIAEMSRFTAGGDDKCASDLREMAKEAVKMVNESIDSFVKKDLVMARSVIAYDSVVDRWFERIKTDLIACISEDNTRGEYYLDQLMVAKYLERIGDHATNIAEWVEYSILGRRSKDGVMSE